MDVLAESRPTTAEIAGELSAENAEIKKATGKLGFSHSI